MTKTKNNSILLHSLIWFVLIFIPYFLTMGEEPIIRLIKRWWIPMFFYAIVFYSNYFIMVNKYLFNKKTAKFILLNLLLLILLFTVKDIIYKNYLTDIPKDRLGEPPPFSLFIYFQMISFAVPIILAIAIKTTQRWIKAESEKKETENTKLQTELINLRYQLQPHFFFNSLNNIYALVDISPDTAKSTIHSLSKLMRYLLYETNVDKVAVSAEFDFLKRYIELMKLRLSDKTKVSFNFPDIGSNIKIAPLLFIALIENAFKHGVSANSESSIFINISYLSETIKLEVKNNNHPKNNKDRSGSGVGLLNLKKRLDLLYPNKYKLKNEIIDDYYIANLEIEL